MKNKKKKRNVRTEPNDRIVGNKVTVSQVTQFHK